MVTPTEGSPFVSVILPTYNRAEFLRRAINSVLAQSYTNWELVIWDDGSTDDTARIVKSVGDKRIRYYYGENKGVAHARNRAIEASHGEYLAFLDSDDEWSTAKLSEQINVMSTYPDIEALFGDFVNVNMTTGKERRTFEEYACSLALLTIEQIAEQLFLVRGGMPAALASGNFIATDTVLVRREALERTGCFREELRNSEDFELWWRMSMIGVNFAYIGKVQLVRYKFPENLSGASIEACKSTIRCLDICSQEAVSRGRSHLIFSLNGSYRNVWQNLIYLYARAGDYSGMLRAFWQSLQYGFRLGTIRLFFQAALMQVTRNSRKQAGAETGDGVV